jgi:hypothetical protein
VQGRVWIFLAVLAGCTIEQGGSAGVEPLADETFAFVRRVRAGPKHLYLYNVRTATERLLSALDDDGQTGTSGLVRLSLSPDRRQVAFTALFRLQEADRLNPAQGVWTLTVDGQRYQRHSPPLPHPGATCQTNLQCVQPETCNVTRGRCEPSSYRTEILDPAFTPDGGRLYFSMSSLWLQGLSIGGGGGLYSVPVGGGAIQDHPVNADCSFVGEPAPGPDGAALLVNKSVCLQSKAGYYRHAQPPEPGLGTPVLLDTDVIGATSTRPVWRDQGSVYLLAREGLVLLDLRTGEPTFVLSAGAGASLGPFAVSPEGTQMVVCVTDGDGEDLHLLDLTSDAPATQLTHDGSSCHPAW